MNTTLIRKHWWRQLPQCSRSSFLLLSIGSRQPETFQSQRLKTRLFSDPTSDAHCKRIQPCKLFSPHSGRGVPPNHVSQHTEPEDFPFSNESSFITILTLTDKLLFLPMEVILTSLSYLPISIVFSHPACRNLLQRPLETNTASKIRYSVGWLRGSGAQRREHGLQINTNRWSWKGKDGVPWEGTCSEL